MWMKGSRGRSEFGLKCKGEECALRDGSCKAKAYGRRGCASSMEPGWRRRINGIISDDALGTEMNRKCKGAM